jgi:oxygen-independent coproporphyrinogen-3 oxidase
MADYLYIHIPFCVRKCIYCDFTSVPYDEQQAKDYADALCRELSLRKIYAGELKTIYIGGGTPSLMSEQFFEIIFSHLTAHFRLALQPEITVEANPGTLSDAKTTFLLSVGVNRISFGVQSFQNDELKALGRIHTSREAMTALETAKKAGFKNVSLDLMYGIPGQTITTWHDTLKKAVKLAPSHFSAYELTPEKGTPLFSLLEQKKIELPGEEIVLEMYDDAIDYLAANEYAHYEISNFARPGFRCRHNLNYWDRGEYLAAGAGSHSFVAGVRTRNTANIPLYIERLRAGSLPVEGSLTISATEALREQLFLGLRKTDGIPLAALKPTGVNIAEAAAGLIEEGYLEIADENLRLTRKGIVLSNTVIVTLFEKMGL